MLHDTRPGPGTKPLLRDEQFLRLWLLGCLGNTMRWLEILASGLYTLDQTGSGLMVALVSVMRSLPMLLFGAVLGAVSETVNRKHIIVFGAALSTATAAVLAVLAATETIRIWHILLGGWISGTFWSTEHSTRRRMVGEMAGPGRVVQAIALDSITNSITRMVGPVLGGLAYELIALRGAFAISALFNLVTVLTSLGIRHEQETRPLRLARLPAEMAEGWAYARSNMPILAVCLITMAMNIFGFSFSAIAAPLGRQTFQVSPTFVGVLAASEPLGSLIGGLLIASRPPRIHYGVLFVSGCLLFMVLLTLMPLSPWYALACLVLVVGGLGVAAFGNMQTTILLNEAPPSVRSRVMGILTVFIGTGPFGVLVTGSLADRMGPPRAVMLMAAVGTCIVAAVGALWYRSAQRKERARKDPHDTH
ncbi:MAG: MFS transporter [Alphaproteobacteria bacterium]|nr:MFS transporter [Alphaproteobacteria bacterium]